MVCRLFEFEVTIGAHQYHKAESLSNYFIIFRKIISLRGDLTIVGLNQFLG